MWRSLFRRAPRPWTLDGIPRPRPAEPPILELIRGRLVGGELPEEEFALPSDAQGLKWAPGALDGVVSHHVGPSDEAARAGAVIESLRAVQDHPSGETLAALHGLAVDVLSLADPLSQQMVGSGLEPPRVAEIGRVLAREGLRPEPVKLGLVLVGLGGDLATDRDAVETLALHSDFTLYGLVALLRMGAGERDLWGLARRVHGWGRIHLVERLRGTEDPDIQAWLLRGGFRNAVMDEYLAYTAAVAGRLDRALAAEEIDDELFTSASDLLGALARGGPAEDLADYEPAAAVLADWLRHARARADRGTVALEMIEALDELRAREELPDPVRREIEALRASRALRDPLAAALRSPDDATFNRAVSLARGHGIDVFDVVAERIPTGSDNSGFLVFTLFKDLPRERLDRALAVARARIDLVSIATGPAGELGLGERFAPHRQLDWVLPALERFPGQGEEFVVAALRSPVIRNRNGAARVLRAWRPAGWSPELSAAVDAAAAIEPDESVLASLRAAVADEAPAQPG